MIKKFIVELDIPENTGDLCWDQDETGLQAFHDCIVIALEEHSMHSLERSNDKRLEFQEFIKRKNLVRNSLKVFPYTQ